MQENIMEQFKKYENMKIMTITCYIEKSYRKTTKCGKNL